VTARFDHGGRTQRLMLGDNFMIDGELLHALDLVAGISDVNLSAQGDAGFRQTRH
jgi:hypothetical protein